MKLAKETDLTSRHCEEFWRKRGRGLVLVEGGRSPMNERDLEKYDVSRKLGILPKPGEGWSNAFQEPECT